MARSLALRFGIILGFFTLLRFVLWLTYYDQFFSDLSIFETLFGFLHGLRFDLSLLLTFLGPIALVMLLPLKIFRYKPVARLLSALFFATALLLFYIGIGDLIYFGYVGRHLLDELVVMSRDLSYGLKELFIGHPLFGLSIVFFSVALSYVYWKKWSKDQKPNTSWVTVVLFVVGAVFAVRGSVGDKPLNIIHAYTGPKSSLANLSLNGPFTAWHSSRSSDYIASDIYSADVLKEILRPVGIDPSLPYPLVQTVDSSQSSVVLSPDKKNIVLVIMESFGAFYVDSFSGQKFNITPNLDSYANHGLKFTNFYATAGRSIESIQAILTSFPSLRGIPNLGLGFEQAKSDNIPLLLKKEGYHTIFAQSGRRGSFRLDAIANQLGFDEYYGREDYSKTLDTPEENPPFGWDYDMYNFLGPRLKGMKTPYLVVIFTGTSHTPFAKPPFAQMDVTGQRAPFDPQHGPNNESGLLNTMSYSDWALGKFVSQINIAATGALLITADHVFPPYRKFDLLTRYRVPLILYAPSVATPKEVSSLGSHLDIMPTILDLSGYKGAAAMSGRSLLTSHPPYEKYVIISGRNAAPTILGENGWMTHSLSNRLEHEAFLGKSCTAACFDHLEQQLFAISQVLYRSFRQNRISK